LFFFFQHATDCAQRKSAVNELREIGR
jgi:hypothetical protein